MHGQITGWLLPATLGAICLWGLASYWRKRRQQARSGQQQQQGRNPAARRVAWSLAAGGAVAALVVLGMLSGHGAQAPAVAARTDYQTVAQFITYGAIIAAGITTTAAVFILMSVASAARHR